MKNAKIINESTPIKFETEKKNEKKNGNPSFILHQVIYGKIKRICICEFGDLNDELIFIDDAICDYGHFLHYDCLYNKIDAAIENSDNFNKIITCPFNDDHFMRYQYILAILKDYPEEEEEINENKKN